MKIKSKPKKTKIEKKFIDKKPDFKLKILLTGAKAAEKSELITKFIKSRFELDYESTVGVEIFTKDVEYEPGKTALLSIWDIGRDKRFEFVRSTFYKGASGALLVFDLTSEETYEETKKGLAEIKKSIVKDIPLVLIGNKPDNIQEVRINITRDEARAFAEKEGITYIETSTGSGEVIENTFVDLTRKIIARAKKKKGLK